MIARLRGSIPTLPPPRAQSPIGVAHSGIRILASNSAPDRLLRLMASSNDSIIQECADCGALIDVTSEEPFARMHCPTCGAAMRVRTRFDQFELEEALGAGGMGAVYRALDTICTAWSL